MSILFLLLGLGLREFSVAPCHDNTGSQRRLSGPLLIKEQKKSAEAVCSNNDPAITIEYLRNIVREIIPELVY